MRRFFVCNLRNLRRIWAEGCDMHEEEKKPVPWEARDPKPPVVQSGHFEKKRAY